MSGFPDIAAAAAVMFWFVAAALLLTFGGGAKLLVEYCWTVKTFVFIFKEISIFLTLLCLFFSRNMYFLSHLKNLYIKNTRHNYDVFFVFLFTTSLFLTLAHTRKIIYLFQTFFLSKFEINVQKMVLCARNKNDTK